MTEEGGGELFSRPFLLRRRLCIRVRRVVPAPNMHLRIDFWILLLGLALARVAVAETPSDVWISAHGDGDGSAADPYDGSSEERFDALLGVNGKLTKAPVHIHLGPGVFVTKGFCLAVNSQLTGAGMDQTIIRLQANAAKIGSKTEVMSLRGASATGFDSTTVTDLTIDGNLLQQPQNPNDVCLSSGCAASRITRVKVINLGTTKPGTGMESFWMGASSRNPANTKLPSYNQIIEDSICVAPPIPGYVTFFDCGGQNQNDDGPATVAARNVILRNDKVVCATPTGTFNGHGFGFANCDSGIIEDCYTDGVSIGYYQDTWSSHKITIRNNVFSRATYGVFFNGPGWTSGQDDIDIEGNNIDLVPETQGNDQSVGVRFWYPLANHCTIKNNRIRLSPGMTTLGARNAGIQLYSPGGGQYAVQIQDNCIDLPDLRARVTVPGKFLNDVGASLENNYDSTGDNVIGQRFDRATFTTPKEGWYVIWGRSGFTTDHGWLRMGDMTGTVTVHTRALVASGTLTLSGGRSGMALPAVTDQSRIRLKLLTAAGTPGTEIGAVDTPHQGFAVRSTSPLDTSTYAYRVDSGNESNSATISVNVQNSTTDSQVLTPLNVTNPASLPGETACTKVKAYADGKNEWLYGYFTGPSIVSVDIENRGDISPNETGGYLFGQPEKDGAEQGSKATMLQLDSATGAGAAK